MLLIAADQVIELVIPLQIDVAFGDVVPPAPEEIACPTLLDLPAAKVLAYPRYSVISEKF